MEKRVLYVFIFLAVSFCWLFPFSAQATEKAIELRYADFMPATDWWYADVAVPWLERIEKAAKGRLKITRYPGGTLVGQREMYEGITAGITDIGKVCVGVTPGQFPLLSLLELPGIPFNNCQVAIHAKWETFKELYPKGVWQETSKVKVLRVAASPPNFLMSTKPVRSLKDLKAMEIRTTGALGKVVAALGATPVAMQMADVYIALQKGTIDATLSAPTLLKGQRYAEVADYATLTPLGTWTFVYMMNLAVWDSLPSDIQKAFEDDADFTVSEEARIEYDQQLVGLNYARERKPSFEVIIMSDAEIAKWLELIGPLVKDKIAELEAKGLSAREVWNEIQKQTEKYNKVYPAGSY